PTTETCSLSLHDALPISTLHGGGRVVTVPPAPQDRTLIFRLGTQGTNPPPEHYGMYVAVEPPGSCSDGMELLKAENDRARVSGRSEEHTSELQSRENLVC